MHIQVQDTLCIVFGALVGDSVQDQEFSHFPNPTCKLREKNSVTKFNTVSFESDILFFQKKYVRKIQVNLYKYQCEK